MHGEYRTLVLLLCQEECTGLRRGRGRGDVEDSALLLLFEYTRRAPASTHTSLSRLALRGDAAGLQPRQTDKTDSHRQPNDQNYVRACVGGGATFVPHNPARTARSPSPMLDAPSTRPASRGRAASHKAREPEGKSKAMQSRRAEQRASARGAGIGGRGLPMLLREVSTQRRGLSPASFFSSRPGRRNQS